jgi:hypothetical protein
MQDSTNTYNSLRQRYPEVINIEQYAEILGVERHSITKSPRLSKIMFKVGNKYRVSLSNVAKLIDGR